MKKYNIIYADCPWRYDDPPDWKTQRRTGAVSAIYPTMALEDIKKLPVETITAEDCVLFLWATMPKLEQAFEVIKAWGFKYRTCAFVWVKTVKDMSRISPAGLGYWTNQNAELVLFGRKGTPKRICTTVKQIVLAPRSRHSQKPAKVRKRIVRLLGDLPRIELFARERVKGWDCWGNEVKSDIEL